MKNNLIIDIDDTLFHWLSMWTISFRFTLQKLEIVSRFSRTELIAIFKSLHQAAGTSERGFSSLDAEAFGTSPEDLDQIHADYTTLIREHTVPFDDVVPTLIKLKERDIKVYAHTDTSLAVAVPRLSMLGLNGLVDALFCSPSPRAGRTLFSSTHPAFELKTGKPNPAALLELLEIVGAKPCEAIYLGDSKMRDLPMARALKVDDVHAAYGCQRETEGYQLLRSGSHWTNEDIEYEKSLQEAEPRASVNRFSEILDYF